MGLGHPKQISNDANKRLTFCFWFKNTVHVQKNKCMTDLWSKLFLLVVDWTMRQATNNRRNGIQWTLFTQLDDLDFTDYIALLSHNHQQMQEKLNEVEQKAAETGLCSSIQKTKVLKANIKMLTSLIVNRQLLHLPRKCGSE